MRRSGMVYARAFANVEIGLKEAEEHCEMVEYLTKGAFHCTVIDISGVRSVSPPARVLLKERSSRLGKTVAVALVTNSFTARVIGNFFLTVNKPEYPVKLFSDALEAQHWARNEYLKRLTKVAS